MELEYEPKSLKYKVELKSYEELMEWLDNVYGPNLTDELEDEHIKNMANDIEINGLKYPVIFRYNLAMCHTRITFFIFEYIDKDSISVVFPFLYILWVKVIFMGIVHR